jgi:hypothetical protein
MTTCPNFKTKSVQCHCQPQDGIMCPHGPQPAFEPWRDEMTAPTVEGLMELVKQYSEFDQPLNHAAEWNAIRAYAERLAASPAQAPQPEQQAQCDGGKCGIGGYCEACPAGASQPEPDRQLLEQALEALEYHQAQTRPIHETEAAIAGLRSHLYGGESE